ncbi:MAG: transcriptional regulator [Citrobacter freundii]|nr:MAG: transcriptional regulator [Citrobacter freundii]
MEELTNAQQEVLRALWQINDGAVSDVLNQLPDPKPAYNTVATVIKVLEKKKYIAHRSYGKTNVYYPLISKNQYAQHMIGNSIKDFFNSSLSQLVSAFVNQKEISINELEEIKNLVEGELEKQKK